jgi:hypothetical protein
MPDDKSNAIYGTGTIGPPPLWKTAGNPRLQMVVEGCKNQPGRVELCR